MTVDAPLAGAPWSVAIFTSREDAGVLRATLQAVLAAVAPNASDQPCTVDLLVDGNATTADAIAAWEPAGALAARATVRLWLLPWGDKACAWNRYVHELAPVDAVAFFVDGYVRPAPDALQRLAAALRRTPRAWAATGVPTVGPSAAAQRARLLADGGLHGNLYALSPDAMRLLRARDFRLPLGLYRNDSLIGAVACFAGDPAHQRWDPTRIAVVADATWTNDQLPTISVARLRAYLKRRMRQAQGLLENAAVRRHLAVEQRPPEQLPRTVEALVATADDEATRGRGPIERLLVGAARRRLATSAGHPRATLPPRLLRVWNGS